MQAQNLCAGEFSDKEQHPDCANKPIGALIDSIVFKVVIRQGEVVEDQDTHCYVMSIILYGLKLTFPLTQYLIPGSNFNIIGLICAPISLLREQTGCHPYGSTTTFAGITVCFDLIFPNYLSKLDFSPTTLAN